MFGDTRAFSGFSVDDVPAAKKFYGETLGLRVSEEYGLLTLHLGAARRSSSIQAGPPAGVVHHSELSGGRHRPRGR